MHTKYLKSAFALAGAIMAAPQAFALVDQYPSIIKVGKGNWTVTKACPEGDGKCKIYDTEPKYSTYLKEITTTPLKELKMEGSTFAFSPNRNYWIVFYPHNRRVAVKLEFAASDSPASKSTLKVTGTYLGDWTQGPQCNFSSPSARAVFVREYFAKANPVSPCLTLTGAEAAKDTSAGLSAEEKSLRAFEMTKRKAMGLTTPDPLGSAPEENSLEPTRPSARDYWRLGLKGPGATLAEVKKAYHKMSLAFHPDKHDGDLQHKAIFQRVSESYELILKKLSK